MKGSLYVKWAELMQAAEAAPGADGPERILSVGRLLLSLCVDILRVSNVFTDRPCSTLERHKLQRCNLDPPGCQQELSVQEIASYDSHIKFWQPERPGKTLAMVQMVLQPTVSLRSQRFSSSKYVKIKLPGSCQVQLAEEVYTVTLPKVLIRNLSEPSADTELAGCLSISCAATGLSLVLKFKDKKAVEGQLLQHTGPRRHPLARVWGFWSGQIQVHSPPTRLHEPAQEGLLFDCEEHGGSVAGSINLRAAEPMHMAALWSCIYDAMSCNKEISSILNPKAGAKKEAKSSNRTKLAEGSDDVRPLQPDQRPPCIQAEHDLGRRLSLAVRCSIQEAYTDPQ
ncbi:hypothetical protein ABBQ38_004031 [Trebouxia sp. C0009 RCD-2024]